MISVHKNEAGTEHKAPDSGAPSLRLELLSFAFSAVLAFFGLRCQQGGYSAPCLKLVEKDIACD